MAPALLHTRLLPPTAALLGAGTGFWLAAQPSVVVPSGDTMEAGTVLKQPPAPASARLLALQFLAVLQAQPGLDEAALNGIFKAVHARPNGKHAFEQALAEVQTEQGISVRDPLALLTEKQQQHPWRAWWQAASFQDLAALYATGECTTTGEARPQASAWEYRRLGVAHSVGEFAALLKNDPLPCAALMGGITWAGSRWPFLAALFGMGMLTASTVGLVRHERAARQHWPHLAEEAPAPLTVEQAHHWEQSGQNLTALGLTLLGAKGIWESLTGGIKILKETLTASKTVGGAATWLQGLKQMMLGADIAEADRLGMVIGLLDDGLLPVVALHPHGTEPPKQQASASRVQVVG
ncbi:MAG: hypothetical protein SFZ03_02060 [Candidatus Melainabacteria bacterium]|nr:hypothetical protein [Candidatus Melainabacteria bacterium]